MNTEDSVDYFALQDRVAELEKQLKDSVEVVRCGECKYRKANGRCNMFADFRIKPSVSDFCSYGERSK